MSSRNTLLLLLVCFCFSQAARADVVFTNGSSGATGGGFDVRGSNGGYVALAEGFTPTSNYLLTSAEAYFNTNLGADPGGIGIFSIFTGNGMPTTLLATLGSTNVTSGASGMFTVTTPGGPLLVANTPYWLVISPGTAATDFNWSGTTSNSNVPFAYTLNSNLQSWSNFGQSILQFEIDGDRAPGAVPEGGSTFILLGLSVVGIALLRVRRPRLRRLPVVGCLTDG